MFAEKDPNNLPWKDLGVELVIESTGVFVIKKSFCALKSWSKESNNYSSCKRRSRRYDCNGVNDDILTPDMEVISNASCTTNSIAPVIKVLNDHLKIKRGLLTTVHSYTNDQRVLDLPHKDLRRARGSSTKYNSYNHRCGKAVGIVIPELKGKLDGIALRVPTPDGSISDLTAEVENLQLLKKLTN